MKKILSLLFAALILTTACRKENANTQVPEITYEVTLINANSWHGSYLNENAQTVNVTNGPKNWKYTFKNINNLTVAALSAYPDWINSNSDAIMKIYVNNSLVTQTKCSISPQAWYLF